ncbi:MAG: phytase [candidate division KSB1 bacterium]
MWINLRAGLCAATFVAFLPATFSSSSNSARVKIIPKLATDSVKVDADDPAIWINPTNPALSAIIGTDKDSAQGGLYVWNLQGEQLQFVPIERPNNVDVRQGMKLGKRMIDIAVTQECRKRTLRVFEINPATGALTDITIAGGIPTPELEAPYGLCLYRRTSDGAMFVMTSSREGESAKHLHQYQLFDDGQGKVHGQYVRAFGRNSILDKVEGLVADDELGYVYAGDEEAAVRKYHADPASGNDTQLAEFALGDGIEGDREGLAIYRCTEKTGYLLLSSQKGKSYSSIKVYRREGEPGNPHEHKLLTTLDTIGSEETDGLEVTHHGVHEKFPHGLIVKHDSPGRQFKLYSWQDFMLGMPQICASPKPNTVHVGKKAYVR